MIADKRNFVVRPQPWWAVCYAVGPVSAGLLPFGLYIYARRKRIPGLEFHALQSALWNAFIAAVTGVLALAEPEEPFWLGIPVLNAAFHLWPVWRVSQGRFFTYPHGERETLLWSVLWLRSLRKEGPQSDIEFSTAILDMQVPPSWLKTHLLALRGNAWMLNREWEKVLADYTAAVEVPGIAAPVHAVVLMNRAEVWRELGDRQEAVADLAAVGEMPRVTSPRRAQALCLRAFMEAELGLVDEAIAHYTAVLDVPDATLQTRAGALGGRSQLLIRKGEWAKSIADADAALEAGPLTAEQRAIVLLNRGHARYKTKDITGALADCEAAIALPDAPPKCKAHAMSNRGFFRYELGDVQAMMNDSRAALELDPTCGAAHGNLGLGSLLNGQEDAARSEYEQAAAACKRAESLACVIEELEKALQVRGPVAGSEPILAVLRARHAELAWAGQPTSGKQSGKQ